MDPEGRVQSWNPAAERIFGYTASEVAGCNLHRLITPERFRGVHEAAFARSRTVLTIHNLGYPGIFPKEVLPEIGLDPAYDNAGEAIGGDCGNLIATLPATDPALPRVILNAHLDLERSQMALQEVAREGDSRV